MNFKLTPATPILVINIILMLFLQQSLLLNRETTSSDAISCGCSSTANVSSSNQVSSVASNPTSSGLLSSSLTSTESLDDIYRRNHQTILIKTVETVSTNDRQAILDALADYDALDEASKNKLTNEKTLLDNLLNKLNELDLQAKLNDKQRIIKDEESNDRFKNIPVCENDYEQELTLLLISILNDNSITITAIPLDNSKYEIQVTDVETNQSIAFDITATFTPCPNFLDIRAAKNTKTEIESRIQSGYFINLIVSNLNTTSMKAAVLARVEDLAVEFGTTINIINDSRSGSTYNFTFVIGKGDYTISFAAIATFQVG